MPGESGSKAALRDPGVELHIAGKNLGDDGFAEVVSGLLTAMNGRCGAPPTTKLEELDVAGNSLTTASLARLADVIHHAAGDLKDLCLADNGIKVDTNEQAAEWEEFLKSFGRCEVLRRLDLSGNEMGMRGFEILNRVYMREPKLDVTKAEVGSEYEGTDGEIETEEVDEEDETMVVVSRKLQNTTIDKGSGKDPGIKHVASKKGGRHGEWPALSITMNVAQTDQPGTVSTNGHSAAATTNPTVCSTKATKYTQTRGLRSVPYLVLANTGLNPSCALHLSYLLASHHLPATLLPCVPPAKAGPQQQALDAYDLSGSCQGIVYLPNEPLGPTGTRLLELAEIAREGLLLAGAYDEEGGEEEQLPGLNHTRQRLPSDAGLHISLPTSSTVPGPAPPHMRTPSRRRASAVSIASHTTTQTSSGVLEPLSGWQGELERTRNKVQGNTLREHGAHRVELWSVALKLLTRVRQVVLERPSRYSAAAYGRNGTGKNVGKKVLEWPMSPHFPRLPTPTAARVVAAESTPAKASAVRVRSGRGGASTVQLQHGGVPKTPSPTKSKSQLPATPDRSHADAGAGGATLPIAIWTRCLRDAIDPTGILSQRQVERVVDWARRRETLKRDEEVVGKLESTQVWRVLEGVGCLVFEVDERDR